MKVSRAIDFHLQYQRTDSKKNTVKTCEFVLSRFNSQFSKRNLASVSQEEVLEFLLFLTKNNKQAAKRNRYSVLASFYNFSINTGLPSLTNPCTGGHLEQAHAGTHGSWRDERNLTPADIQERTPAIKYPKSGRVGEAVYVPRKLLVRLTDYVKAHDIGYNNRIFLISYVAAWSIVRKSENLVNIELRPHDSRQSGKVIIALSQCHK
jgi:hypothetical protein